MLRNTLIGFLGLAFAIVQVAAHGHLSVPVNRGYSLRQDENNAPVAYPFANDFVCRNSPVMPASMWPTYTAGQSTKMQWAMESAHPGDCFAYISYDADKADNQKKWFKIAQYNKCNLQNLVNMTLTIPSFLPSSNHAILRWEWYALHLRDINIVEFYSQCSDIKIVGSANGQLPTPQVTIPGHLPMAPQFYRSDYKNYDLELFTGPPIATIGGAAYDCKTAYDNSCTVEPPTTNPCKISNQRCMSATQFQSCGIGATTTEWSAAQSCQTGLVCFPHPDGAHIMCSYPTPNYVAPTLPASSGTPAATQAPTQAATQAPAPTQAATQAPAPTQAATQAPAPTQAATQAPTPASAGGSSCVIGSMRCTSEGSTTFEICSPGGPLNIWAGPQTCQAGLACRPDGAFIRCDTPVSKAPTTVTQSPVSTPTPTASTSSACSAAKLNYQQCSSNNLGYRTCTKAGSGYAWSAYQYCQTGLTCHPSTTANNIYCY